MKTGTEVSETNSQPPALAPQLWLVAGYGFLMSLQWARLEVGILIFSLVMPLWQLAGSAGLARRPGFRIRTAVTVVAVALFFLTLGKHFTLDSVVAFFVLSVALKWLELRHRRDLFVMVLILLYLGAVNFLFRTGAGWALLTVIGVLLLFNALARSHAGDLAASGTARTWRQLLGMMATATPMVALLFVFFPRIGPLWSVPLVTEARTGMTDQIRPGDLASLVRSGRRVFRVRFGKGGFPAPQDRYWRGLFLDRFADGVWRAAEPAQRQRPSKLLPDAPAGPLAKNEYEVLMEPSYHRWAFALRGSVPASGNVYRSGQGLIRFRRPADALIRYRLRQTGDRASTRLSQAQWRYEVRLPVGTNPRTRAWANQMAGRSAGVAGFVNQILHYFHDQPFFYTLHPPPYGDNGIDRFMFGQRRGFCAHYASAMAFALRAVGIPARIVVGYLGGQEGLDGRYLIVRQYDAHAWVEFWMPGKGWTRVDPTAAIAASRVEKDLWTEADRGDDGAGIGWSVGGGYRGSPAWNWVALRLDALNFAWERWVVNYHGQTQMNLIGRLKGLWLFGQLGWLALGFLAVGLVAYIAWVYRSALGTRDPFKRLYDRWLGVLVAGGVDLTGHETPMQAADRARRVGTAYGRAAENFARLVSAHYYAQAKVSRARLKQLLREQKRLNGRAKRSTRG